MKILAISDWRIQSLEMIKGVIGRENPDLLLYAGDDLERIMGIEDKIYFKSYNYFIECELMNLDKFLQHEKVANNPVWPEILDGLNISDSSVLNELDIPLVYINGNDDHLIEQDGEYFLNIFWHGFLIEDDRYIIYENLKDQIDLITSQDFKELSSTKKYMKKVLNDQREFTTLSNKMKKKLLKDSTPFYELNGIFYTKEVDTFYEDPLLSHIRDNGIYINIKPDFGKLTINVKHDSISIFGSSCSIGRKSKIINPPTEYADIFLSHIPPIGKLDLSKRFGIDHIGSEGLLESVKKYNPKFVICGHSHIWGGMEEKIGDTVILNVSSQDNNSYINEGHYAIIDTGNWSYKTFLERNIDRGLISLREVRGGRGLAKKLKKKSRIYLPIDLVRKTISFWKKHIDLLKPFISYDRDRKSEKPFFDLSNMNSLEELDPIFKNYLGNELSIDLDNFFRTKKRAEALQEIFYETRDFGKTYEFLDLLEEIGINTLNFKNRIKSKQTGEPRIKRSITFDPDDYWFVDVETGLASGLEPGELWLIGIGHGKSEEITQFRYPEEKKQFFQFIKDNEINTLVSWTNYDSKVLKPILDSSKIDIEFYDACARTANALEFYTYRLHELYDILFPEEKTPKELIPGRIAGLYADHLIFDDSFCPYCSDNKESIIREIIKRNKLDVIQTIRLCKSLYNEEEFRCSHCGRKFSSHYGLKRHKRNKACINSKP